MVRERGIGRNIAASVHKGSSSTMTACYAYHAMQCNAIGKEVCFKK